MRYKEIQPKKLKMPTGPAKPEGKLLDAFHNIKHQCRPFLDEINNAVNKSVMYRGIHVSSISNDDFDAGVGIKNVRLADRVPKDMDIKDHNSLNQYFQMNYGHKFRNGIFVTGDMRTAAHYGKPYAVLPIGEFSYIWHPYITDLYTEVGDLENGTSIDNWMKFTKANDWDPEFNNGDYNNFGDFVEQHGHAAGLLDFLLGTELGDYKQDNLIDGLAVPKGEIMVWCKQYYYLEPKHLTMLNTWLKR